jgi:hypothetical protein
LISSHRALLAVDTCFIGIPRYSKKAKKEQLKDIYHFKNAQRFAPFCKEIDLINQKASLGLLLEELSQKLLCAKKSSKPTRWLMWKSSREKKGNSWRI